MTSDMGFQLTKNNSWQTELLSDQDVSDLIIGLGYYLSHLNGCTPEYREAKQAEVTALRDRLMGMGIANVK